MWGKNAEKELLNNMLLPAYWLLSDANVITRDAVIFIVQTFHNYRAWDGCTIA